MIRILSLVAVCLACMPATAQLSTATREPANSPEAATPGFDGPEITAPVCTRSRTSRFVCGGLTTGLGMAVAVPSARILIEALRADPSEEDPLGIGSSLGAVVIVMSGLLVVLGGTLIYLGVRLLVDAFRPLTKYAIRPLAGPNGAGSGIRVRIP